MRIRVVHVDNADVNPVQLFKDAAARKVAWLTGTTEGNTDLVYAARDHGYKAVFDGDQPLWLAVREDIILEDSWVASTEDETIFAAFDTNVDGLGELLIAAGYEPNLVELAEALDRKLVFFGGLKDGFNDLAFHDEDDRIKKVVKHADAGPSIVEAVITI